MIAHADMDAFYAQVEALDRPELRGLPVIVGAGARGVVATCSYEARPFGVHSAMPLCQARKLCPQAVFVPPRMDRYAEVSREIFSIFESFTPVCEGLSLDEAFLDLRGTERLHGHPVASALRLRREVRRRTGLTVSVGVAHNKFLAKLASDENKPDGFFVLTPETCQAYLDGQKIGRLWGVGKASLPVLLGRGIRTIGDLRRSPRARLESIFGRQWTHFHRLSLGEDDRPVVAESAALSSGRETTFDTDLVVRADLVRALWPLCETLSRDLHRQGLAGRTVTLKVRTGDFRLHTRARTLPASVSIDSDLFACATGLLDQSGLLGQPVRLLGVSVSRLDGGGEPDGQMPLFEEPEPAKLRVDRAVHAIKDRFGEKAITKAIGL